MSEHTHGRIRLTLGNLAAAIAACGLMAAVIPPSLAGLKQRMEPVTCANNLRVCYQAWNVYANDYNGLYMAPWDRRNPWPGLGGGSTWPMQWPFTMVHFVTGGGIPEGETVWMSGAVGPWYAPDGRHGYPPEYCSSPEEAPQLQCQTSVAKGIMHNQVAYNLTSYSYAIMGGEFVDDSWRYGTLYYPKPGLMTHPSTTLLLMDLSGILTEGMPNVWCTYDGWYTNPHDDTSNYLMCDGHVDRLPTSGANEQMWQSMWTPDPPAAAGTN